MPWLSVVDFNTGKRYVFDTEKKITNQGLNNSSTKLLNKGNIIISARGTVGVLDMDRSGRSLIKRVISSFLKTPLIPL
ncbi:MAG: hypothetical protein U9P80_04820 [Thermodesulfobacteriota bacterium]|nr:hypothetical protein [Thermodesulfobacteriota bacterium]